MLSAMGFFSRCLVWGCLLLLFPCHLSFSPASASTLRSDVTALQELLRAWQETPGLLQDWSLDEDADPCGLNWRGVSCFDHTITALNLRYADIVGNLPAAIGGLQNLETLDLSNNPRLVGAIPKEIGNLRQLTSLKLSNCDVTGDIPAELSSLMNLATLDLSHNKGLFLRHELPSPDASSNLTIRKLKHMQSGFGGRRALLAGPTPSPAAGTHPPVGTPAPANSPTTPPPQPTIPAPAPASTPDQAAGVPPTPTPAANIAPKAHAPAGSTRRTNVSAIVAGTIVGVLVLAAVICLVCRCKCFRRGKRMPFQRLQMT